MAGAAEPGSITGHLRDGLVVGFPGPNNGARRFLRHPDPRTKRSLAVAPHRGLTAAFAPTQSGGGRAAAQAATSYPVATREPARRKRTSGIPL